MRFEHSPIVTADMERFPVTGPHVQHVPTTMKHMALNDDEMAHFCQLTERYDVLSEGEEAYVGRWILADDGQKDLSTEVTVFHTMDLTLQFLREMRSYHPASYLGSQHVIAVALNVPTYHRGRGAMIVGPSNGVLALRNVSDELEYGNVPATVDSLDENELQNFLRLMLHTQVLLRHIYAARN